MILLRAYQRQEWAVNKLLEWSDWVFLPFDKCGRICSAGTFQTSFVDLLCFCSVLCLLCLCARLFICALWSPAGKGLTSWLSFVVSTVSLSLSH